MTRAHLVVGLLLPFALACGAGASKTTPDGGAGSDDLTGGSGDIYTWMLANAKP